jgi:putative FmdB family regulatory protein
VPLYEYQCGRCGRFERIQKFADPTLTECPTCGQPVEKLLSSPAIQFKGSGWYITDYARKGNGGKAEGAQGESGKADSTKGDSAKSDSAKEGTSKPADSSSSSPQSSTSKDSSASGSSSSK